MNKVGILYDNISGNPGDVAIGLSVKKILRELKVEFEELVPGRFNPKNYDTILVGGGHLLRENLDFFYDKFKIPGNHILNTVGIHGKPSDLHYLNDYRYVSVRSEGDKAKINYLKKEVKVVPDTSMLLEDLTDLNLQIKGPSLGIHLTPSFIPIEYEDKFSDWVSSLGLNVYLLPITHYNQDFVYLRKIGSQIKDAVTLPILNAQEIFTVIGRFDYFISCSLHGAIFSYIHNKPFIGYNFEKIKFFMEDRNLGKFSFSNFDEMKATLEEIVANRPDYSNQISNDKKILATHIKELGEILSVSTEKKSTLKSVKNTDDMLFQSTSQINFLQSEIANLDLTYKQLKNEINEIEGNPLGILLSLYSKRSDLRKAYPEVRNGDYSRLIDWAGDIISKRTSDSAFDSLKNQLDWFLDEQKKSDELQLLTKKLEELELDKKQNAKKIESLNLLNDENLKENNRIDKELQKSKTSELEIQSELDTMKISVPYLVGKDVVEFFDKNFPPTNILGKMFRKIFFKYTKRITRLQQTMEFNAEYELDDWIDKELVNQQIESLEYKPKFSIIIPVYNTNIEFLKKAINSIKNQYYTNWQICICDDGSTKKEIHKILKDATIDNKIDVVFSKQNEGISVSSNKALQLAKGEYTLFLDHDDELAKNALLEVVKTINKNSDVDFIYSDEDKIDQSGKHIEPFFKPDWSPDLFFSYNYPIHVSVFRTQLLKKINGFRREFDGSQDYDLILRYLEHVNNIEHIPKVLYSWRKITGSTALNISEKSYAFNAGKRALTDALRRRKIDAICENGIQPETYHVKYRIKVNPLVSIIIPTRYKENLQRCIHSILTKTTYKKYEIIVMDSSRTEEIKKFCQEFDEINHKKVTSKKFNFSKVNNDGVLYSKGEYIIFLNDDTKVVTSSWIERLLENAQRVEVGAVGAKLLYQNNHVQHAGTVVGIQHHAGNYGGMYKNEAGYFSFANIVRNCSAVTAACMMIRKDVFDRIGGFDENLAKSWQDVDLCVRLIEFGKLVLFTPYSILYHYEGFTRGNKDSSKEELEARKIFRQKHREFIQKGDPYYNPNLSLNNPFKIAKSYIKPLRALYDIYEERDDLRKIFPNEQNNGFKKLIDWVVTNGVVTDSHKEFFEPFYKYYFQNCSKAAKPLAEKIKLYYENKELQNKFPEVKKGQFKQFLNYLDN